MDDFKVGDHVKYIGAIRHDWLGWIGNVTKVDYGDSYCIQVVWDNDLDSWWWVKPSNLAKTGFSKNCVIEQERNEAWAKIEVLEREIEWRDARIANLTKKLESLRAILEAL